VVCRAFFTDGLICVSDWKSSDFHMSDRIGDYVPMRCESVNYSELIRAISGSACRRA
jgi:hypothetical protein